MTHDVIITCSSPKGDRGWPLGARMAQPPARTWAEALDTTIRI